MNLARGSDLAGISTLKEKRFLDKNIVLARPFLIFNRNETIEICKEFNLPIWVDPFNEDISLTNKYKGFMNNIYKNDE